MMQNLELEQLINQNPKIKEALSTLHSEVSRMEKNKEKAAELLGEILGISPSRPKRWDSNSNASYYKEKFGVFVLDKIITRLHDLDRDKDLEVEARPLKVSRGTLKIMVIQGWLWLIEHSSEEDAKRYKQLREDVTISKCSSGVTIRWKDSCLIETEGDVVVKDVPHTKKNNFKWKSELDEFISNAQDNDKLVCEGLDLSGEQLDYVKNMIDQCQGFFIKVLKTTRIEIIKNLEVWKRIQEMK